MISAFQSGAFQRSAFQINVPAVVVEDDYDSHWHYAKVQKQRRQKERELRLAAKRDERPVVVLDVVARMPATSLRALGAAAVAPILAYAGATVAELRSDPASTADVIIRPIVRAGGVVTMRSSVSSEASIRVVNVLDELRDLEDMMDLYELLIAA